MINFNFYNVSNDSDTETSFDSKEYNDNVNCPELSYANSFLEGIEYDEMESDFISFPKLEEIEVNQSNEFKRENDEFENELNSYKVNENIKMIPVIKEIHVESELKDGLFITHLPATPMSRPDPIPLSKESFINNLNSYDDIFDETITEINLQSNKDEIIHLQPSYGVFLYFEAPATIDRSEFIVLHSKLILHIQRILSAARRILPIYRQQLEYSNTSIIHDEQYPPNDSRKSSVYSERDYFIDFRFQPSYIEKTEDLQYERKIKMFFLISTLNIMRAKVLSYLFKKTAFSSLYPLLSYGDDNKRLHGSSIIYLSKRLSMIHFKHNLIFKKDFHSDVTGFENTNAITNIKKQRKRRMQTKFLGFAPLKKKSTVLNNIDYGFIKKCQYNEEKKEDEKDNNSKL